MDQRILPDARPAKAASAPPAGQSASRTATPAPELGNTGRVLHALVVEIAARRAALEADATAVNVHALRGALRRAGAALKLFKHEVGARDVTWSRSQLKWLARQYCEVRDLDVLIAGLESVPHPWTNTVGEGDAVRSVAAMARETACGAALARTASARGRGIVEGLLAWSAAWRPIAVPPATYAEALMAADAKVRARGARIGRLGSHARHRLRARIKSLRYQCEALAQLTAEAVDAAYFAKLTLLHQILGDMHDAEVGLALAARLAKPLIPTPAERKRALARQRALKLAWADFRSALSPWDPQSAVSPKPAHSGSS